MKVIMCIAALVAAGVAVRSEREYLEWWIRIQDGVVQDMGSQSN